MTINVGTIGSAPCEIVLNKILIEADNSRITKLVMSIHQTLNLGLKKLEALKQTDVDFFKRMALLLYEKEVGSFKARAGRIGDFPEGIYTHALCCYKTLYRRSILQA